MLQVNISLVQRVLPADKDRNFLNLYVKLPPFGTPETTLMNRISACRPKYLNNQMTFMYQRNTLKGLEVTLCKLITG